MKADYDKEVIEGTFKDEFEYWNKMSEFSVLGRKVYYNFDKARNIVKNLCKREIITENILEVGAGLGMVAGCLISGGLIKYYQCTECGEGYIKFLAERWGIRAKQAKMKKLPFEDKSFSMVFLFDVLEHIKPEERAISYTELKRVLKDEATIYINNPSKRNISYHSEKFDFTIGFTEIEQFANFMGLNIASIDYYCCDGYGKMKKPNYYHFIELTNRENK